MDDMRGVHIDVRVPYKGLKSVGARGSTEAFLNGAPDRETDRLEFGRQSQPVQRVNLRTSASVVGNAPATWYPRPRLNHCCRTSQICGGGISWAAARIVGRLRDKTWRRLRVEVFPSRRQITGGGVP